MNDARDPRFAELDREIGPVDRSLRPARRWRRLAPGGIARMEMRRRVRAQRARERRFRYLKRAGRWDDLRNEGFR